MALVLKSDVSINGAALGDKHGIIGAVDWRYMLDFANDDYVAQSKTQAKTGLLFSDIIDFTRNSSASYTNKQDRMLKAAAANQKRIHFSESMKRNGLLVERKKINYFLNSDAPKTQTINLVNQTTWFSLVVEGSGSALVSGSGVSSVSGLGTETSPIIFKNTASTSRDVNVTITGSLSFVQLSVLVLDAATGTKVHTLDAVVTREVETAKVKNSILSPIFSTGSGTILVSVSRYNIMRSEPSLGTSNPLLEVKNSINGNHIAIARVLPNNFGAQDNQELRVRRYFSNTELSLGYVANNDKEETVAISWGNGMLFFAQNGKVTVSSLPSTFTPDTLELGSSTTWTGTNPRLDGIITKAAIYDRQLTEKELVTATKN